MHVATAILSRSFALRGSAAVQKERGVREAYLDSHKGKQMLTNSQLQQHEEGWHLKKAGFNRWPCFISGFSITHSMAQCTGEHGIHSPNKTKHTNMHGHTEKNKKLHILPTQTPTLRAQWWQGQQRQRECLDVHMSVRGARSLHKPHHLLCHLRHQRRTGSCFKTFTCSSAAFHSPYRPPAYQHPPRLWPQRSSGALAVVFPLRCYLNLDNKMCRRTHTNLRWPALLACGM